MSIRSRTYGKHPLIWWVILEHVEVMEEVKEPMGRTWETGEVAAGEKHGGEEPRLVTGAASGNRVTVEPVRF